MNVYAMKQLPDRRTLRCECPLRRRRVRSRDDHLARPLALYACAGPREAPCIPSESIRSEVKLRQPPPKPTRFNLTSQFRVSFFFLLSNLYGGIPIPANISFVVFLFLPLMRSRNCGNVLGSFALRSTSLLQSSNNS